MRKHRRVLVTYEMHLKTPPQLSFNTCRQNNASQCCCSHHNVWPIPSSDSPTSSNLTRGHCKTGSHCSTNWYRDKKISVNHQQLDTLVKLSISIYTYICTWTSMAEPHTYQLAYIHIHTSHIYRMAGNFGGKIFWRIAENMSFGGIYFGG